MKAIQVQLTITLDDPAANTLAELLAPAIKRAIETPSEAEQQRTARLRASQNAIFAGAKPPEDKGLLIDSKEAAKLLGISDRTLWKMQHYGRDARAHPNRSSGAL